MAQGPNTGPPGQTIGTVSGDLGPDFQVSDTKLGGPLGYVVQGLGWLAGKLGIGSGSGNTDSTGPSSPSEPSSSSSTTSTQADSSEDTAAGEAEAFDQYAQMTGGEPDSSQQSAPQGNDGVQDTNTSDPNPDPSQPDDPSDPDGPTATADTDGRERYDSGGEVGVLPTQPSVDQPEHTSGDTGPPDPAQLDPSSLVSQPDGRDGSGNGGGGPIRATVSDPTGPVSQPTTGDDAGIGGPAPVDPGRVDPTGPVG